MVNVDTTLTNTFALPFVAGPASSISAVYTALDIAFRTNQVISDNTFPADDDPGSVSLVVSESLGVVDSESEPLIDLESARIFDPKSVSIADIPLVCTSDHDSAPIDDHELESIVDPEPDLIPEQYPLTRTLDPPPIKHASQEIK